MLPLMRRTVIGLTVFFFLASCLQLLYLNQRLFDAPKANVRDALSPLSLGAQSSSEGILAATRLKAIVTLEASALDLQYHQAGVLLMSRLWTTYLGFVTGMIFALVGAMFVLGKLESDPSELKTKVGTALDTSFKSASPGLVLAVLGVILMITTIVTHHTIDVTTRAVYLRDSQDGPSQIVGNPPPLTIPDPKPAP